MRFVLQEKSFENIKNWIRNIEENATADVERMLLGNKCELDEKRQVTKERGEQLAVEYGIKFMETSAKASINVEEAFYTLARDIKAKTEKRMVSHGLIGTWVVGGRSWPLIYCCLFFSPSLHLVRESSSSTRLDSTGGQQPRQGRTQAEGAGDDEKAQ